MTDDYVLITTLCHFKVKYAVPKAFFDKKEFKEPVDREELLDFLDEVKEFSQAHLGNVVVDIDVLSEKEILSEFDKDNDYLSSWPKEQKLEWLNNFTENNS